MRKTENRKLPGILALVLGALFAVGVELLCLLAGSVAVSSGILRSNAVPHVTIAACFLGCLAGGVFCCLQWSKNRLPAGLGVGVLCYALILSGALLGDAGLHMGMTAYSELAACLVGGVLAGLITRKQKKGGKRLKR